MIYEDESVAIAEEVEHLLIDMRAGTVEACIAMLSLVSTAALANPDLGIEHIMEFVLKDTLQDLENMRNERKH